MFPFVHQLCQLEHTSNPGRLKLITNSSIKFSSPHDIFSSTLSPSQQLSSLISANVWVSRGNGLVFSFSFDTEGISISSSDRINLVETLGVLVRDAKLWSQLGLQVALVFPTNRIIPWTKQPDFLLKLSRVDPQQGLVKSSKAGGRSSVTGDTNPPSGVSIAHLEEVAITWRFSLAPASALVKRRKADQSFSKFGDEILCEITGGKNDTSFLDDILYSRYPHQEFCRFQASEPTATDALELEDDSILDTDYSSQESIASSIFSQGFYSNGSTSSSCMLLPEDSAAPQETVPGHKVVIKEWAKLVGLSFRSLISSDKRAVRGITSAQSSIEPKLAEISPPLFSPGYLPAVAHRNAYIPTITRSIAAVYNRSKSSTLRIEIEQMTNLSLEERLQMLGDELGFETDSQPTSVMTPAITLRLWQICQRILFDPAAARYLSPLRLNTKQSPAHNCTSQEMLDEEDPCYSSNRASAITQHETSIKDLESQGLSDQATSLESLSEDALFEELESLDQHILLEECGFDDGLFCDSLIPLTEMSRDNDLHLPDVILDELEDDDFYDSLFTTGTLASDDDLRTSERIDELRADPLSALNNGVHDESCPIDEHMLEADLENTPSQYSCPIDEHMLEADLENTPSHYYNIEDDSMKDGKMDETYDPFDIKSESSDQMLEDYEMEDMDLHTRYLDENLMSD